MTTADRQVEQHINKPDLERLIKQKAATEKTTAAERERWAEIKARAEAEKHLHSWAFATVVQLNKMDPAKAAFAIRALMLYIDHLGLAMQTDIEDAINASHGEPHGGGVRVRQAELPAPNGNGPQPEAGQSVEDVLAHGGQAALQRLRTALNDTQTPGQVRKGLENFLTDWPALAAHANELAEARIAALHETKKARQRKPQADPPADTAH